MAAEIGLDERQGVADLQHGRGVHDVLGGGAPVDVAAGIAALLGELMHDADDRVADEIGLRLELREVDGIRARGALDRIGCVLRDDAGFGLGNREGHFDLDVFRHHRCIGEHRAHGRRAEGVAENARVENGGRHGALAGCC